MGLKHGLNGSVFHNMNRCFVENVKRNDIFCKVEFGNGRILWKVTVGPPLWACCGGIYVQTGRIKKLFMSFLTNVLTSGFFRRELISKF